MYIMCSNYIAVFNNVLQHRQSPNPRNSPLKITLLAKYMIRDKLHLLINTLHITYKRYVIKNLANNMKQKTSNKKYYY